MLTVDPQGLTDAGGQVETSAGVLAGLDVAGPFSTVSDALVGSRTSQSCLWVSTRLGAGVQVYSEGPAGARRSGACQCPRLRRHRPRGRLRREVADAVTSVRAEAVILRG